MKKSTYQWLPIVGLVLVLFNIKADIELRLDLKLHAVSALLQGAYIAGLLAFLYL